MKKEIQLGNKVRCIVTGFEGIAVSKINYINGCVQFCVKPEKGKENKMPDGEYIDVQQLVYVSKGVEVLAKPTGGHMPDSPKANGLSRN